ncbi:MAG: substrate-binding periplasmic protein [Desulfococcaceae bacterium]
MLDPFMMEEPESKKVVGVTIDYWKEFIAPEMGVDFEVAGMYPILRATQMLKNGEVDVVSQLTKIPEREAEFLYPETALTSIVSCLVVLKDSPLREVSKSEDLYGMTIGFIKAAYIPEMLKHEKIKLDLVSTTDFREMNYNKLVHKRLDAFLDINYVSMKYWLGSKGYLDRIRFIMLPVTPPEVYSIFRNTAEGAALRDAFDKANRKGISEKVFEKMSEKYLKQ